MNHEVELKRALEEDPTARGIVYRGLYLEKLSVAALAEREPISRQQAYYYKRTIDAALNEKLPPKPTTRAQAVAGLKKLLADSRGFSEETQRYLQSLISSSDQDSSQLSSAEGSEEEALTPSESSDWRVSPPGPRAATSPAAQTQVTSRDQKKHHAPTELNTKDIERAAQVLAGQSVRPSEILERLHLFYGAPRNELVELLRSSSLRLDQISPKPQISELAPQLKAHETKRLTAELSVLFTVARREGLITDVFQAVTGLEWTSIWVVRDLLKSHQAQFPGVIPYALRRIHGTQLELRKLRPSEPRPAHLKLKGEEHDKQRKLFCEDELGLKTQHGRSHFPVDFRSVTRRCELTWHKSLESFGLAGDDLRPNWHKTECMDALKEFFDSVPYGTRAQYEEWQKEQHTAPSAVTLMNQLAGEAEKVQSKWSYLVSTADELEHEISAECRQTLEEFFAECGSPTVTKGEYDTWAEEKARDKEPVPPLELIEKYEPDAWQELMQGYLTPDQAAEFNRQSADRFFVTYLNQGPPSEGDYLDWRVGQESASTATLHQILRTFDAEDLSAAFAEWKQDRKTALEMAEEDFFPSLGHGPKEYSNLPGLYENWRAKKQKGGVSGYPAWSVIEEHGGWEPQWKDWRKWYFPRKFKDIKFWVGLIVGFILSLLGTVLL